MKPTDFFQLCFSQFARYSTETPKLSLCKQRALGAIEDMQTRKTPVRLWGWCYVTPRNCNGFLVSCTRDREQEIVAMSRRRGAYETNEFMESLETMESTEPMKSRKTIKGCPWNQGIDELNEINGAIVIHEIMEAVFRSELLESGSCFQPGVFLSAVLPIESLRSRIRQRHAHPNHRLVPSPNHRVKENTDASGSKNKFK